MDEWAAGLVGIGILAGVLNTIAGGGSLLTLPALMLSGLPADVANATNRVGILAQGLAGVHAYDSSGALARDALPGVAAPTVVGALGGSLLATRLDPGILEPLLWGLLVCVALGIAVAPRPRATAQDQALPVHHSPGGALALLLAGAYGGFVQAGVGFFLLAALVGPLRYDLLRANALKVACNLVFGAVALLVFQVAGEVRWVPGLLLALGMVVGARVGVRLAIRLPERLLRWAVVAVVLLAAGAAAIR